MVPTHLQYQKTTSRIYIPENTVQVKGTNGMNFIIREVATIILPCGATFIIKNI